MTEQEVNEIGRWLFCMGDSFYVPFYISPHMHFVTDNDCRTSSDNSFHKREDENDPTKIIVNDSYTILNHVFINMDAVNRMKSRNDVIHMVAHELFHTAQYMQYENTDPIHLQEIEDSNEAITSIYLDWFGLEDDMLFYVKALNSGIPRYAYSQYERRDFYKLVWDVVALFGDNNPIEHTNLNYMYWDEWLSSRVVFYIVNEDMMYKASKYVDEPKITTINPYKTSPCGDIEFERLLESDSSTMRFNIKYGNRESYDELYKLTDACVNFLQPRAFSYDIRCITLPYRYMQYRYIVIFSEISNREILRIRNKGL